MTLNVDLEKLIGILAQKNLMKIAFFAVWEIATSVTNQRTNQRTNEKMIKNRPITIPPGRGNCMSNERSIEIM